MGASPTIGEQVALALALVLAFGLALAYVRRRGHGALPRRLALPAALFVAFCLPDALLTLGGTWDDPAREADPFVRAFLLWDGWKGLVAALVIWVLGWTLVVDGLEALRLRLPVRAASLVECAQVYVLYAVALGHLDGLSAWTHHPAVVYSASNGLLVALARGAPWSISAFPLAYVLYPSLVYAALFTALHLAVAAAVRRAEGSLFGHRAAVGAPR